MPESSLGSDSKRDYGEEPPGVPSWVKWLAVAAVVLGVVLVAIALIGGGDHGPARHGLGDEDLRFVGLLLSW